MEQQLRTMARAASSGTRGRVCSPPCTAREGVARVRDNKLHESLDLGTAWKEKA